MMTLMIRKKVGKITSIISVGYSYLIVNRHQSNYDQCTVSNAFKNWRDVGISLDWSLTAKLSNDEFSEENREADDEDH